MLRARGQPEDNKAINPHVQLCGGYRGSVRGAVGECGSGWGDHGRGGLTPNSPTGWRACASVGRNGAGVTAWLLRLKALELTHSAVLREAAMLEAVYEGAPRRIKHLHPGRLAIG